MHETGKVTRRKCLKSLGTAGLGAAALVTGTEQARAERIHDSQFDYRFRTYRADEEIKVGMIGTVGHRDIVLNDLPKVANCRLVAYSNTGDSNIELPAGVRVYETYDEMLDREELDVVGVCLPYSLNAKASIAAARSNIHIITEKPVATTLDDMQELLETVIDHGVRLTTMLNMRMLPRFQAIYTAVGEGAIGEPILATGQKSYKFGKSRPDFYKAEETYGGTIPWVGIHALDYIHFTTRLNYTDLFAYQGNKDHPDYPGFQDFAGVVLRLDNGGTAMVNIDYLRPETAPSHGDDRLRIIGSEGVIEIKDLGARVELITSSHEAYDIPYPEEKFLFADFMAELRDEAQHVVRPAEPFEMTRVALLAHQSAKQHTLVRL